MNYKRKKIALYSVFIIAFSVASLYACTLIDITFQIDAIGEIFPKEKWTLIRGDGGQIISNLIDFTKGHTTQYNIFQFERGELVSTNLSGFLGDKNELSQGDTILSMKSSDICSQLLTAESELKVASAQLQSKSSSEKEPLIKEAEHRLKYTQEKANEQKIMFERSRSLFEKGLCSKQEYETQKWNYDLLAIEDKIYSAQLENLKTGVKPEEIQLLKTQIQAFGARVNFLRERESQMYITSPIQGKIIPTFTPDTFLNITNYSSVVLHLPVRLKDLSEFYEGQRIPVSFATIEKSFTGKILTISKEIKIINEQQAVFISVLFENNSDLLLPGMVLESAIKLRRITLFDYLIKTIAN